MVFTVRCFKCGDDAVRLVLGGRAILHARCHSCGGNLLAEVLEFEQEIEREKLAQRAPADLSESTEAAASDPPTGEFPDELLDELEIGESTA